MSRTAETLVAVDRLTIGFGGLLALDGVSFTVEEGAICGIIGPNGAGKSTLLNALCAIYPASAGEVRIAGASLARLGPADVAALGVGRTFQNLRLFATQTCVEHVKIGFHRRRGASPLGALLRTRAFRDEEARLDAEARQLLAEVGLPDAAERLASSLPYGAARRLEIARALAGAPRLLLLDEPAAGLTEEERRELVALVVRLQRARGLTVLLIEHDMKLVFELCETLVVLDHGVVIGRGTPAEVAELPQVVEAYLGAREGSSSGGGAT